MFTRSHSTIRSKLTCLVIACVLPVWLVAGALVFHAFSAKRNQVNNNMLETTRAMSMVVDRELSSVQAALQALATSSAFANGDFANVHRQALELLKSYPGADIIVADKTGQQMVNSYLPYGDPLPKRKNIEAIRTIFESAKPLVSDLYYGAVTKRPMIGIDVPVFRDGKVAFDLGMALPSDRLAAILSQQKLPKDWYCSILDGKRVIVARTLSPEKYVGKQANPAFRQAMMKARQGTAEVNSIAGTPVLASFCKSSLSDWAVAFGVPKAAIMAETYQWMGWAIGSAATISLIGIMIALGIARRIAQDIQTLVTPALSIGRGEVVTTIDNHFVRETEEVALALVQASELLQIRAQERDAAERKLSSTIDLLQDETEERIRATESLLESERLLIQQSRQAALGEMINNIAHQWRQPLNTLGLTIQQLSLFYDLGKFDRDFLSQSVGRSMGLIQHMSKTIDDFRHYFRHDKEKVKFNVHEAIVNTLSLLEGSLQKPKINIEIIAKDVVVIEGFQNEFIQVILNILINARDAFIENGIDDPMVTITIRCEDSCSVITIADNAGGIPVEIIGKIFDPYFTTKGPQQGTGIGLFMSKAIIEKNMGGRLAVRNIANGAEFRIEVGREIRI